MNGATDNTSDIPIALVTGATGFIGSHLVKRLKSAGYIVRVYARQSIPHDSKLSGDSGNWITGGLQDEKALRAACRGVSVVFHLAGIAHSGVKTAEAYSVNSLGTQCVYSASVCCKVKKFVFISSILASDPAISSYAESKSNAEKFLLDSEESNVFTQVVILRLANVYGPGMRGNIRSFIQLAARGVLPLLPRLENTFPMISVRDVCEVALAVSQGNSIAHYPAIFNITDGEQYTPNRIESAVYNCVKRGRPRWRISKALLFVAALLAHIIGPLAIFRIRMGLHFYNSLVGKRKNLQPDTIPTYEFAVTGSLEAEMPLILESLRER